MLNSDCVKNLCLPLLLMKSLPWPYSRISGWHYLMLYSLSPTRDFCACVFVHFVICVLLIISLSIKFVHNSFEKCKASEQNQKKIILFHKIQKYSR